MYDYQFRQAIRAEAHARPLQSLNAPLSLVHIAVLFDGLESTDIEHDVLSVIRADGYEVDDDHPGFLFYRKPSHALRYELHNEFYTLTLYKFGTLQPLLLPEEWSESLPGALLSGVEVLFRKKARNFMPTRHAESLGEWGASHFNRNHKVSSLVMDNTASIVTDFEAQPESGFIRFLVEDKDMRPSQSGRLLQRICEIETYRCMALLSLPEARLLMPKITELDQRLASLSQRSFDENLSEILARMMNLAAEVEALSATTANRFAATEAYFALVEGYMKELNEQRVEGRQTIKEFLGRHLAPARRTTRSAATRIELLSKRIARATELIQSQVNLAIEQQNKELLEALNTRGHRKMRLQAKLEGLSVVVIAYYLYDLVDLALKNLLLEGELLESLLTAITLSLPFVIVLIYLAVRRMMKIVRDD
ncbi:DUF3422 domain-containing protein [Pontibacterium granulatum]|uniref:DUF3422 domain-containing protein n=1 Tax=Pontibacterium granulatum TaxID=2036029 RepID=UPI002499D6EA|nr:DUF3422 domain-containing protein [Pontibacterium granulatum]MDI3326460.1 DUF3422 domain-containing protein [Pontibacterium granulatum]